ncbi:MAG: hypothetical protein P8Y23_01790 [Candidatus Lokiarchaeota archaeon]|jgi:hypothetical protein
MSKAISYYDWSLGFKKFPSNKEPKSTANSLGLDENIFKEYLNKWKEKNLN